MLQKFSSFLKRYGRENDATAAIEFSFVVMPFLLMLFGVMESGRIGLAMNGVQYAVEETSRYAAMNAGVNAEDLQIYADDKLSGMFVSTENFTIVPLVVTSGGVDFIEISAVYSHTTLVGDLLGDFGNFEFNASARRPIVN